MTAAFALHRHADHSGVSGTGVVAEGAEFSDGWVALHWPGDNPSTAVWKDIRGMEAIHGHGGDTEVRYDDNARLVRAYKRVVPWLTSARYHDRPNKCEPHLDHPDCLRLTFLDEKAWRWWVALLDGSTHAATHVEVDGEMRHTWIHPSGDLWLIYHTPLESTLDPGYGHIPSDWEDQLAGERYDEPDDPLETFDREDR